jgi:hypothetical protein
VVGLAAPLFTDPEALLREVIFRGEVPTASSKLTYGITQEPVRAGGIGRCAVDGISTCRVNMLTTGALAAEAIAGDPTRLVSTTAAGKAANVLAVESGTGEKWAVVRLETAVCGCATTTEPPPTGCCGFTCADQYTTDPVNLTDMYGAHTLHWFATGGYWRGCYAIPNHPNVRGENCSLPDEVGPTAVEWRLRCDDAHTFTLTQHWPQRFCFNQSRVRKDAVCSGDALVGDALDTQAQFLSQTDDTLYYHQVEGGRIMGVWGDIAVDRPTATPTNMRKLYLSDGFGTVPLIYNGPRPIPANVLTNSWFGCALRTVNNAGTRAADGSANCDATSSTKTLAIVFVLSCPNIALGYRLWMYYGTCTTPGKITEPLGNNGVRDFTIPAANTCATPWTSGYSSSIVPAGDASTAPKPPSDCDPFVWGPVTHPFPDVSPPHPLRGVYGDSGTWTITA